jgi:hypothetical protein
MHTGKRRLILALLALVLALGAGSAIAAWVVSRTNPGNQFSAGSLALGDSVRGPVLSADGLAPGDAVTGTVSITNGSTLAVSVTLAAQGTTRGGLAGTLQLVVTDCGRGDGGRTPDCATGTTVYSGALDGLGTVTVPGSAARGRWAASEAHLFRFVVALPAAAPPGVQGQTAATDFVWTAGSS